MYGAYFILTFYFLQTEALPAAQEKKIHESAAGATLEHLDVRSKSIKIPISSI